MNFQRPNSWVISFNSHHSQKRSWLLDTTAHLKEQFKWVIQVSMLREESALIIYLKLGNAVSMYFCPLFRYMGRISHNNNTPPSLLAYSQTIWKCGVGLTDRDHLPIKEMKTWRLQSNYDHVILKPSMLSRVLLFSGTHFALVVSQAW